MERWRGTCIAVEGAGLLLTGPSGAGKSDLALRVIEAGGRLVSDDYTCIAVAADRLVASPPEELRGLLEVRGIGIVQLPFLDAAPLSAIIDLVPAGAVERLPGAMQRTVLGVHLPLFRIAPLEPSAVAKVHLVTRIARGSIMRLA